MARRKPAASPSTVLFDVLYEDGSISSNRKVPGADLDGLDGDDPARTYLEEQEQLIEQKSGQSRPKIKSISRSKVRQQKKS